MVTKKVSRSCGFQIDLDDNVVEFIEEEGKLFVICEHSVFEIITADSIDPDNSCPETRHSYKKAFCVGANSQSYKQHYKESIKLLESPLLFYIIGETEQIKKHISHSLFTLLTAERTYVSLKQKIDSAIQEFENKSFEVKGNSFLLPQLPMIDHLQQDVSSFFSYCKKFCEESNGFIKMLFPEVDDKGTKKIRPGIEKSNYAEQTKKALIWLDELLIVVSNIRNALYYNHQRKGQTVHIYDFSNTKGNVIMQPCIEFDLSNYKNSFFESGVRYILIHFLSKTINILSDVFSMILNVKDEYKFDSWD